MYLCFVVCSKGCDAQYREGGVRVDGTIITGTEAAFGRKAPLEQSVVAYQLRPPSVSITQRTDLGKGIVRRPRCLVLDHAGCSAVYAD